MEIIPYFQIDRVLPISALTVAGFMLLVSIWTPLHDPSIPERWFSPPRLYFVWAFPALGVAAFCVLFKSLCMKAELAPFVSSVALFISAYLGFVGSHPPACYTAGCHCPRCSGAVGNTPFHPLGSMHCPTRCSCIPFIAIRFSGVRYRRKMATIRPPTN